MGLVHTSLALSVYQPQKMSQRGTTIYRIEEESAHLSLSSQALAAETNGAVNGSGGGAGSEDRGAWVADEMKPKNHRVLRRGRRADLFLGCVGRLGR